MLNSASLKWYVENRFGGRFRSMLSWTATAEAVAQELDRFGIGTVQELDALLNDDIVREVEAGGRPETDMGILRTAMLWNDIDRYFETAYAGQWQGLDAYTGSLLRRKYPARKLEEILRKHGIALDYDRHVPEAADEGDDDDVAD